ncbi:MAG: 3-dehydroquinate synthase [Chloroflexi bacterium]|nr:3-dehydroquinate synthase [Chloroflexota bacterium]
MRGLYWSAVSSERGCEGCVRKVDRVVLIGFSGTGKTTVARLLAENLGWTAADSDAEIERHWQTTIPTIFREHGESAFRTSERVILRQLLSEPRLVVATGGGAAVDPTAWADDMLGRETTLVVALDASPETILTRLQRQTVEEGEAVERPLLEAENPLQRIRNLKSERQSGYDAAHLTICSDGISAPIVADEIAAVVRVLDGQVLRIRLDAPSGASDVHIAPGALARLGAHVRERWPTATRAWIVTDTNVGPLHARAVERALRDSAITSSTYMVPAGEGSKSLATTGELYDWLLGNGVERGDVVVALGGGVVGDLAGFVASTALRGIGLAQVPTSLLAAVDSSVGGKTGINHAAGKNLIGAFHQPPVVVVDSELLRTMPPRELRSGWAEIVKHSIIQRSTPDGERGDLANVLRRNVAHLKRLEEPATSYVVWRNIALKAAVVAADEREMGIRAYLNFGHTLGHAIEAADYQLLHGEAVALGMRAAAELGVMCGTCGREEVENIAGLVDQFELPASAEIDEQRVFARLGSDKKRMAGRQRYVLPLDGGGVTIRDDVSENDVRQALATVSAKKTAE